MPTLPTACNHDALSLMTVGKANVLQRPVETFGFNVFTDGTLHQLNVYFFHGT